MPVPTRDLILDAAERTFARLGFAAATIKAIGTEAGVNTALLYYYFTDKETLYHEVLGRLVGGLVEGGVARLATGGPPEETIRALVQYQAEFLLAHPNAPKLIVRELVDHEAAHAGEQIRHLTANLFDRVCGVIERGQEAGLFRPELEPRFAAISIIAQVAYFFIARPAVVMMLREAPGGPSAETVRAFARQAADFSLAALLAPPAGVKGRGTRQARARAGTRRRAP